MKKIWEILESHDACERWIKLAQMLEEKFEIKDPGDIFDILMGVDKFEDNAVVRWVCSENCRDGDFSKCACTKAMAGDPEAIAYLRTVAIKIYETWKDK